VTLPLTHDVRDLISKGMDEMDRLSDVDGKDTNSSSGVVLLLVRKWHALLDLVESTNNEEHRIRAILKADLVVDTMNQFLPTPSLEHGKRATIEKVRDDLQARLERVAVRQSVLNNR
jgi:hypothetical protein